MKEVKLPSGAVIKINPAPFADARALYQSVLEEVKGITIFSATEMTSVYKDLFCAGFSSKKIELCLWECMKRCTYNNNSGSGDMKIDQQTFEPISAREDYITVCMEVAKENINPFVKSLYAEFGHLFQTTQKGQP